MFRDQHFLEKPENWTTTSIWAYDFSLLGENDREMSLKVSGSVPENVMPRTGVKSEATYKNLY